MFRKEKDFVERSRSLLKTKEVKALKRAILQQLPALTEETLQEILPSKGDITAIKLADRTLLYSYEGGVLFFDLQGRNQLFPTVLALAKAPTMLRAFVTHGPVSRFVLRGADFMVPGVGNREELRGLKKGERCCIKIHGNPIPFAVGESGLDFEDLQMVSHGKALVVLHSFGDLLVSHVLPAIPLPGFTKEEIIPTEEDIAADSDEEEEETDEHDKEAVDKEENNTVTVAAESVTETTTTQNEFTEEEIEKSTDDIVVAGTDDEVETAAENLNKRRQEVDDRLRRAVALCIRYVIKDKQLPILLSSFWSMVLRCLNAENQAAEWANSSFRRPAELFSHCQTINLLQCQDDNGVISITLINRTHELLRVHKYRDPEKLKVLLTKADSSSNNGNNSDNKHYKKSSLQVIDVYKLPKKMRDIFGSEVGGDLGVSFLRGREIRQVLLAYANERGLERPNGMLLIPVDDPLLEVVAEMGDEIVDGGNNEHSHQQTSLRSETAKPPPHTTVELEELEESTEAESVIGKHVYSMMDDFYLNPSSQQTGLKMKSSDGDFPPLLPAAAASSVANAGQKVKFHKAVELPPPKPVSKVKPGAMKQPTSAVVAAAAAAADSSSKKRVSIADNAASTSSSSSGAAAITAISISFEKCCLAIQSKLTRYHAILPNADVSEAVIKSGPIPKVKVLSEKRAGNKMVTIVRGLDPFGIDLAQLAKACQKKFACSVAVGAIPGIAQQREIVIQGSASMELEGFLIEEYGLPRGVIDITMPKASSGKKK